MARSLAGEATLQEQLELDEALTDDPQLALQFQLLSASWDHNEAIEKTSIEDSDASVFNLLARINLEEPVGTALRSSGKVSGKVPGKTFGKNVPQRIPLPPFQKNLMIGHHFRTSIPSMVKNKLSSFINIAGLGIGMAVALLIGLWVRDELRFNTGIKDHSRIAQVMQNQVFNGEIATTGGQAMQLSTVLKNNYGQNFEQVVLAAGPGEHLLTTDAKKLVKTGNFMEPGISDLLRLSMLQGPEDGLKDINSIFLSRTTAHNLFGDEDVVGRLLKIDNKMDVKIAGVYADLPENSDFANLGFIAPWDLFAKSEDLAHRVDWGNSWFQLFVRIPEHQSMDQVTRNISMSKANAIRNHVNEPKATIFLHPMDRWHLHSEFTNGVESGGNIQYVWLFSIIGFFVLLLACINFMNLSTARSEKRAKEVGIRKAIGSLRSQLIGQFVSESLLYTGLAFLLSLALAWFALPYFNQVAGKQLALPVTSPSFLLAGVAFSLVTGLLSSSYPALYLSSFQPISVLKGTFRVGGMASVPRKVLVVVQFTVSVTLIICTTMVFRQISFARNRPVGYNRNGLISVPIKTADIADHFDVFRQRLLNTGAVQEVSGTDSPITNTYVTNSGFSWPGKDPSMQDEFVTLRVTNEFGSTVGWSMKEGRNFSSAFRTDSSAFVLNEAAVKYMNLRHPVGETIRWGNNGNYQVIGVIRDMVTQSPYAQVRPTIFLLSDLPLNVACIRLKPDASAHPSLAAVAKVFAEMDPANPFQYSFADQDYGKNFQAEERNGKLATFFTALAVLISCLGLFGLASFVAEQRVREIGIRKVLGASVTSLWQLLTREFVILVMISLLIATPLSWWFLHNWLQQYHYRAALSWWIFAASGACALLLTILTVSVQAIRAALADPARSLRTE